MQKRILIIEDELMLAKMYQIEFERQGFKFDIALTGEEGLERIKNEKPDLIFLNLILPHMQGKEVLKNLKEDKQTKDIPVIILSDYDPDEAEEILGECKANMYLMRANFTPGEIVDKAREIIASKNK